MRTAHRHFSCRYHSCTIAASITLALRAVIRYEFPDKTSMTLHRYWFTFNDPPKYSPLGLGCGVTAFNYQDAVDMMNSNIFANFEWPIPTIQSVIEDVDIRHLDQGHVIPNMGSIFVRGVWFPLGY
jgi:hypothetical protein